MSQLTVSDVATALGVDRATAYGLINLMQKKGLLEPTGKQRHVGKGKSCHLYNFTRELAEKLADLVAGLEFYEPVAQNNEVSGEINVSERPTAEINPLTRPDLNNGPSLTVVP